MFIKTFVSCNLIRIIDVRSRKTKCKSDIMVVWHHNPKQKEMVKNMREDHQPHHYMASPSKEQGTRRILDESGWRRLKQKLAAKIHPFNVANQVEFVGGVQGTRPTGIRATTPFRKAAQEPLSVGGREGQQAARRARQILEIVARGGKPKKPRQKKPPETPQWEFVAVPVVFIE